jgi:hypothetical protein
LIEPLQVGLNLVALRLLSFSSMGLFRQVEKSTASTIMKIRSV